MNNNYTIREQLLLGDLVTRILHLPVGGVVEMDEVTGCVDPLSFAPVVSVKTEVSVVS